MIIGIGIWAFVIYITVVLLTTTVLKRTIAESLAIGLAVVSIFSGREFFHTIFNGIKSGFQSEVVFAITLFMVMSKTMEETGIIDRLVSILNSILGKFRGGPAYIATCASALFGLISGSGTGSAATVGSITIPWMIKTGWPREIAALVNAGNSGLGIALPPSSSMLTMLGFAAVAEYVTSNTLYVALLCGGLYTLAYRLVRVRLYVKKYNISATPKEDLIDFRGAMEKGGSALTMFLGIAIPLVLTMGPVSAMLKERETFGSSGVKSINIIVWVPVLITAICLIEGHKCLPRDIAGWKKLAMSIKKSCYSSGGTSVFALAGSSALAAVGFGDDFQRLIGSLDIPTFLVIICVGIIIVLLCGPLGASQATVCIGPVVFSILVGAGVNPVMAVVVFLVIASTEGTMPPSTAPALISCGIAEVEDVKVIYKPMVLHYVIPVMTIGILLGLGILPVFYGG